MSLTSELKSRTSPVSEYLVHSFPGASWVQESYRAEHPPLLVPKLGAANWGTLGGAFDWRLRYLIDPQPMLGLAVPGALAITGGGVLLTELESLSRSAATAQGTDADADELLVRVAWALSLFTEVHRTAAVMPGSPLRSLPRHPTVDDVLALAPDDAVAELQAMSVLARERLVVPLVAPGSIIRSGPASDGSFALSADADIVVGDTLLEVKTAIGRLGRDGARHVQLLRTDLFQLVGYLLCGLPGTEDVRRVAYYNARFGYLRCWDAEELLNDMTMYPVTLEQARADFQAMLRFVTRCSPAGGCPAGSRCDR